MSRSLKIESKLIPKVKMAVKRNCFPSQRALAIELGLAISTVGNFLRGNPVDYLNFVEISEKLGLDWQEIAAEPEDNLDLTQSKHSSPPAFYVERPPIEADCYQTIRQSGALLRIKGSQQMGKTRLMHRVLDYARDQGGETVTLSFELADHAVFLDLEKFSQWFCVAVGKKLGLPNQLADYWEDMLASNYNTTSYFQDYLLTKITRPLVLALDKVDLVFEHEEIATDFCRLLRNWHDQAKRGDRYSEIWQKLRLVIVHATEIYGSLDINASPLAGVGVVVALPEFNPEQLQNLAQQHGLTLGTAEVEQLMNLVGGHPYLLQLALEQIKHQNLTLTQLVLEAPTEAGIYSSHLRQQLGNLQQHPELAKSFREVVTQENPVELKPVVAFKLQSMGLVKLEGNAAKARCELYRKYFPSRLSDEE